jgi:FkbM family methyltransferase
MYGNQAQRQIETTEYPEYLEMIRAPHKISRINEFFIDWTGVCTRMSTLPWAPQHLAGTVSTLLPIPDDGYRSEAEEYVSLSVSLMNSKDTFTVVELGAGWSPWVTSGLAIAKRMGKKVRGVSVEADATRCKWSMSHLKDNGFETQLISGSPSEIQAQLMQSWPDADAVVVNSAIWDSFTTLSFPSVDGKDMGGAARQVSDEDLADYRGQIIPHVPVSTCTFQSLINLVSNIDLLHIDVQGYEFDFISHAYEEIAEVASYVSIGTHNRLIEGQLQDLLLSQGWSLLIDEPSKSNFDGARPSLTGFTVQDGIQLWNCPSI